MTNITALFLVLTLTGAPAASVACVAECRQAPATSGHCHEYTTATDGPMISARVSCYDPSVVESLYLTESRAPINAAILAVTASPTTAKVRTDALAVVVLRADACLKPPLVLRI